MTIKAISLVAGVLLLVSTALAQADAPVGTPYIYKTVSGRELRLWVLPAAENHATAVHSAVVFFHGGGWVAGPVSQFNRQSEYLAARGMTAIQVEYRFVKMNSDEIITSPIEDAKSAIRWIRHHAAELRIDPERIAAAGASAGGQLAAFLGTKDGVDDSNDDLSVQATVQAMVLFNPAVDLGPDSSLYNRGGREYQRYSPLFEPKPYCKHALLMTGEADVSVPAEVVRKFNRELNAVGVQSSIIVYPGKQHGFFNLADSFGPTLMEMDKFFAKLGWITGSPDIQLIDSLPKTPPKWN